MRKAPRREASRKLLFRREKVRKVFREATEEVVTIVIVMFQKNVLAHAVADIRV